MKIGEVQIFEKKHEFKGAVISIQNCIHEDREDVLGKIEMIHGVEKVNFIS